MQRVSLPLVVLCALLVWCAIGVSSVAGHSHDVLVQCNFNFSFHETNGGTNYGSVAGVLQYSPNVAYSSSVCPTIISSTGDRVASIVNFNPPTYNTATGTATPCFPVATLIGIQTAQVLAGLVPETVFGYSGYIGLDTTTKCIVGTEILTNCVCVHSCPSFSSSSSALVRGSSSSSSQRLRSSSSSSALVRGLSSSSSPSISLPSSSSSSTAVKPSSSSSATPLMSSSSSSSAAAKVSSSSSATPQLSSSSSTLSLPSSSSSSAVLKPSSSSSAASMLSSSSSAPRSPSSSTANGAAYSDPYFHGFWNQPYYVHGRPGSVYSLLSDQHTQLNARFVFLSNVTCPLLDEPAKVHCSSHPGTYFGEMGLVSRSGDRLYIASGDVDHGFGNVTVNGRELTIGEWHGASPLPAASHQSHTTHVMAAYSVSTQSASHGARPTLYVHRTSVRSLVVHIGLYELLIENSDRYVDLVQVTVVDWTALLETVQPSGLMGASWNNSAPVPPPEDDHMERDGELMGCNIAADKFCLAAGLQQQ